MRVAQSTLVLGLLVGLGACSDMMGGGSTAPRPMAAATQPTVSPDMVKQVQAKLRDNGYYKQGEVDGVWGVGTETAVRSFQHDHNLGSSGQLDVPTLQAMNLSGGTQSGSADVPARMQSGPADVPARTDSTTTQPMRTYPNRTPGDNTVAPAPR
jgi:peptidoglycan hydrolase-like protein with peptidoglycan-binding domain